MSLEKLNKINRIISLLNIIVILGIILFVYISTNNTLFYNDYWLQFLIFYFPLLVYGAMSFWNTNNTPNKLQYFIPLIAILLAFILDYFLLGKLNVQGYLLIYGLPLLITGLMRNKWIKALLIINSYSFLICLFLLLSSILAQAGYIDI